MPKSMIRRMPPSKPWPPAPAPRASAKLRHRIRWTLPVPGYVRGALMNASKRVIHLHIPSELGYEKVAMGAVRSVAYSMGFSNDRISDLQTAVSEACTNAIEHGNRLHAATRVEVVLTVGEDSLEVDVMDK